MREPAVSAAERAAAKDRARPARRWRRWVALGAVAALGLAGSAKLALRLAAPVPADARTEIIQSLGLFAAGNYSAARSHAMAATRAEPRWALAQAVLARSFLALGDGVAARSALDRAIDAGFDRRRVQQLYAHAYLLEGDTDQAIAAARQASPTYAGYALRVAARADAADHDFAAAEQLLATVLAANPRNAAAWSDLGRIRYQAGDIGGAIVAAGRAVALDRNNTEALTLRGELVRTQFGPLAALPWFEAALRHDAYYHPALIEYAATLGDVGRHADMLAATRRALAAQPGSAQAYYLQAVLASRAGRYDLARTLLTRTRGKLDALPAVALLAGTLDYQGGDDEQAIAEWRSVLGRQPFNLDARRLLGAALLRSGDAHGTLDMLRPLALRSDADPYTLMLVARAFERTGERDWAGRYLDRAAWASPSASNAFGADDSFSNLAAASAAEPDDPVLRMGYLRGLLDSGDNAGALREAQALAQRNPGVPAAHVAVGDMLMLLDRADDAAAAYRRAADLRFDEPTMLRLVDALDRAGHAGQATEALALYLSQNPASLVAQRLAAHRQIAAGAWREAIDTLEALRAQLGDRDVALLTELAYAYTGADDADTGLRYAKAAYRLSPMNPAACDAYGWALYQLGRDEPALQLFEKAASIAPGETGLRWHLAQAQADLGRNGPAAANIRAILADHRFADRAAASALLKAL